MDSGFAWAGDLNVNNVTENIIDIKKEDSYTGDQRNPLSLNLYTYMLENMWIKKYFKDADAFKSTYLLSLEVSGRTEYENF